MARQLTIHEYFVRYRGRLLQIKLKGKNYQKVAFMTISGNQDSQGIIYTCIHADLVGDEKEYLSKRISAPGEIAHILIYEGEIEDCIEGEMIEREPM